MEPLMAQGLLVHADGTVECREMEREHPVYRVLRQRPLTNVRINGSHVVIDDYTRRGRLFDGRPVFCAEGFCVEEFYMDAFTESGPGNGVVEYLTREAERHVWREYPEAIELDRWVGIDPHERLMYQSQGLTRYGVRLLVAVKVLEENAG